MKKVLSAFLAVATIAGSLVTAMPAAQAQYYHGHHHHGHGGAGAAIGLGLFGGGAEEGGAARFPLDPCSRPTLVPLLQPVLPAAATAAV